MGSGIGDDEALLRSVQEGPFSFALDHALASNSGDAATEVLYEGFDDPPDDA